MAIISAKMTPDAGALLVAAISRTTHATLRQLRSGYTNLFSISVKNALKRATKADSVSLIFSPTLSFTTDFSGPYLIVLFVLPAHITPWFCRSEVQIIRNPFRELPSFPSRVRMR